MLPVHQYRSVRYASIKSAYNRTLSKQSQNNKIKQTQNKHKIWI